MRQRIIASISRGVSSQCAMTARDGSATIFRDHEISLC